MADSPPSKNDRTEREQALFAAALERSETEREAFLDGACLGETALRQRLEVLLAAHEQPAAELASANYRRDEFHESPSPDQAGASDQGLTEFDPPGEAPDEAVGQTLGRYKLMERVGEGGCGVVYVA